MRTINNNMSVLSSLLKFAVKRSYILAIPWDEYPFQKEVGSKRRGPLTRDQVDMLLADVDKQIKAPLHGSDGKFLRSARGNPHNLRKFVYIAAFTGMRKGEILALDWASIDWDDDNMSGNIHVEAVTAKNSRHRAIPISEKLYDVLNEYRQEEGRVVQCDVKKALKSTLQNLDIWKEGVGAHSLRHALGTQLAMNGTPIRAIQSILGQANINTTERYMHEDEKVNQAAVNRLSYGETQKVIDATERFPKKQVKNG